MVDYCRSLILRRGHGNDEFAISTFTTYYFEIVASKNPTCACIKTHETTKARSTACITWNRLSHCEEDDQGGQEERSEAREG